ncbi:phage tail sheath family protein [filamentous cyanobacterium CCP3]|nr:phage tail sheath family protein [filamentous cyanobacterium CCP3]
MASTYKTPGVYIEEISKFPPSVAQVETAIPAFIGYTQKAIVNGIDQYVPTPANPLSPIVKRITSMLEYEQSFGEAEPETEIVVTVKVEAGGTVNVTAENPEPSRHNMFYSLQAYFANGGGPCYIVSVGKTGPSTPASINEGRLVKGVSAIEKEDEITLIVVPESLAMSIGDSKGVYEEALKQCAELQDRFVVMDVDLEFEDLTIEQSAERFRSNGIGINNLKYGAAYGPCLNTIFDYAYKEEEVTFDLPPFKTVDGKQVLDPQGTAVPKTLKTINPSDEHGKNSGYGQLYPLIKSAIGAIPVVLPPSPLVVGVYAMVDNTRGVWKAPANVSLSSVVGPTIRISSDEQEGLNVHTTGKSINAIRSFVGKGTLIWGARTLAGNDNEWRYVPVRRFFNMAEESIKKATEGFVFEPNDSNTWTKVRSMIENFLLLQWRAGALQGAKPEQSFYVKIGLNETMTALDILEGRMIVEIGMAVVRPAEFIILKFSHKMAES